MICVGSTEFDDLISTLDNEEFMELLQKNGFNKLVIQYGLGSHKMKCFTKYKGIKCETHSRIVLEPIID